MRLYRVLRFLGDMRRVASRTSALNATIFINTQRTQRAQLKWNFSSCIIFLTKQFRDAHREKLTNIIHILIRPPLFINKKILGPETKYKKLMKHYLCFVQVNERNTIHCFRVVLPKESCWCIYIVCKIIKRSSLWRLGSNN